MNIKRIIAIVIAVIIIILNAFMFTNTAKKKLPFPSSKKDIFTTNIESNKDKIAVIEINSVIENNSYYDFVIESLDKVIENNSFTGLILRFDTPGGSVYETVKISDKIKELKAKRQIPIYASVESMCASGGYYIAVNTDKIFANEDSILGSIGVIMSNFNFNGLMEKYGIKQDTVKSGEFKDMGSPYKPVNESDRAILQTLVNNSYERFVNVVSKGRNINKNKVLEIADGRIYDGQQAKNLGLIDDFGYYEDTLNAMKKDFNLSNSSVYVFEIETSLPRLFSSFVQAYKDNRKTELEKNLDILTNLSENENRTPMYLYGGI